MHVLSAWHVISLNPPNSLLNVVGDIIVSIL